MHTFGDTFQSKKTTWKKWQSKGAIFYCVEEEVVMLDVSKVWQINLL
jgi:hypothetical protein